MFNEQGWTVEDLRKDYGVDLLVRVFRDGKATEYSFFVQLKATEHVERYLKKDARELSYPVSMSHLRHWYLYWEPVLLVVWDASKERFNWECIQTALDESDFPNSRQKTLSIAIPITNDFDAEGLKRVLAKTKSRFKRFVREKEGAEELVRYLQEKLKLKITYEPQDGLLTMPDGQFVPDKDGGHTVVFFGRNAQFISEQASKRGISTQELMNKMTEIMTSGMERLDDIKETIRIKGSVILSDNEGRVRTFNSIADYVKAWLLEDELKEAD